MGSRFTYNPRRRVWGLICDPSGLALRYVNGMVGAVGDRIHHFKSASIDAVCTASQALALGLLGEFELGSRQGHATEARVGRANAWLFWPNAIFR